MIANSIIDAQASVLLARSQSGFGLHTQMTESDRGTHVKEIRFRLVQLFLIECVKAAHRSSVGQFMLAAAWRAGTARS
jgi:hypothetical protein